MSGFELVTTTTLTSMSSRVELDSRPSYSEIKLTAAARIVDDGRCVEALVTRFVLLRRPCAESNGLVGELWLDVGGLGVSAAV